MVKILQNNHHTVTDWDWQDGALGRSLYAGTYISPPTCLRLLKDSTRVQEVILCKEANTLVLPEGEFREWHQNYYNTLYPAIFRNQAANGTANWQNQYELLAQATTLFLRRYNGGVGVNKDSTLITPYVDVWKHYRTLWWNGKNGEGTPALCVELYIEEDSVWVKQGSTLYDVDNYWKDSAINRCGFRSYFGYTHPEYFDDAEIWGPE